MKPVLQTIFGKPHGNCFAACLASIFEEPLEQVPHFHTDDTLPEEEWSDPEWWPAVVEFCRRRGKMPIHFDEEFYAAWKITPVGEYIACGMGKRGLLHACVMYSGQLVHDPFPQGDGLLSITTLTLFVPVLL